jgi:hypothetical protein
MNRTDASVTDLLALIEGLVQGPVDAHQLLNELDNRLESAIAERSLVHQASELKSSAQKCIR